MRIGIFDSGIGGLSVLHEAYHQLPDQDYIFYADTDHVPYGKRDPKEIMEYSRECTYFLLDHGVDAVVIACNTATSVAVKQLREEISLPIVSMEPAVKPAVETTEGEGRRVLVMATPVALKEARVRTLIERVDEEHRVDLLPMPELVNFAEREQFDTPELLDYLTKQFATVQPEVYSALVLGCTHFNYFKDQYRKFFPADTALIDGNFGTVRHLAHRLGIPRQDVPNGDVVFTDTEAMLAHTTYYTSGRLVEDTETLEHFRRLHNRLEEMRKIG
ncbi:MAG: glutamate racemase [Eubacterium sp.]|nr:glutamate racemase [Eubacterium sp.]